MILKSGKRILADDSGFSVGELMTVVSLIGIVTAVGIPSFLSFQPSMRLNGAAREVLSRLNWARANAVQNNNTSVVTFLNDHSFQIFNDANGNGSADANETVTINLQTNYSDVTFAVTGSSSTTTRTAPMGAGSSSRHSTACCWPRRCRFRPARSRGIRRRILGVSRWGSRAHGSFRSSGCWCSRRSPPRW